MNEVADFFVTRMKRSIKYFICKRLICTSQLRRQDFGSGEEKETMKFIKFTLHANRLIIFNTSLLIKILYHISYHDILIEGNGRLSFSGDLHLPFYPFEGSHI